MTPEGRKRDYDQAPLGVFLTTDTTKTATTEARSKRLFLIVVPAKFIDAAKKKPHRHAPVKPGHLFCYLHKCGLPRFACQ